MHLLLIRHGQSFVNLEDWTEGYIDAGLTPLGQQQAARLAEWVHENLKINVLYSSTMARTLETASYLEEATGLKAVPDHRLREFGNCYADGSPVPPDKMPVIYPEFWGTERPYSPICPGGESWLLFRARVGSFLNDIITRHAAPESQEIVAVMCHGGVIDASFDTIFDVGPHRSAEIWSHNTGIVHFEYFPQSTREKWRLHAHGLVHHLMNGGGEWLGSEPMLRKAGRNAILESTEPPEDIGPIVTE